MPHSQKVMGLNPPATCGFSVCSLHVPLMHAWHSSGYSSFLQQTATGVAPYGDSKLSIGVNVHGCLSLSVSPVIEW